jgi:hypothetical protein
MPSQATDPLFDESDLDNPAYYCVHGTFTGNPYGADYLCHYCEMGYSAEEYAQEQAYRARRNAERRIYNRFCEEFNTLAPTLPRKMTDFELSTVIWVLYMFSKYAR